MKTGCKLALIYGKIIAHGMLLLVYPITHCISSVEADFGAREVSKRGIKTCRQLPPILPDIPDDMSADEDEPETLSDTDDDVPAVRLCKKDINVIVDKLAVRFRDMITR